MSNQSSNNFPLFGILGVAFIILKLTSVISWSWWWVLAPFWGPLLLALVLVVPLAIIASRQENAITRYRCTFA